MKKELTSIVRKTARIGAAVCVAAGAVALMTSGVAIKALAEGGKYLKGTVEKIIKEEPREPAAEVVTEVVAEESDFAKEPASEAE